MLGQSLEIAIDLYELYSNRIQKLVFYSVCLVVGDKEAELSHKKSSFQTGIVSFHQSLSLKVSDVDLQHTNRQIKLIVYSIHHYGRKVPFGHVMFTSEDSVGQSLKLKLSGCEDEQAQLRFYFQINKIETRIHSRKGSSSKISDFSYHQKQHPQSTKNSRVLENKNKLQIDQRRTGEKQSLNLTEPNKANKQQMMTNIQIKGIQRRVREKKINFLPLPNHSTDQDTEEQIEKTFLAIPECLPKELTTAVQKSGVSVTNNLKDMEQFEIALKNLNTPATNSTLNSLNHPSQQNPKSKVLSKIFAVGDTLSRIQKKKNILSNDDQILKLIAQDKAKKNEQNRKINFSCLQQEKQLLKQVEQRKLKLNSKVISIAYTEISKKPKKNYNRAGFNQVEKSNTSLQNNEISQHTVNETLTIKKENQPVKKGLVSLLRPKTKIMSPQQWQNDDQLSNTVPQMIQEVKGNVGYIKLSKITNLNKKVNDNKNINRELLVANQALLENQEILMKKLEISQQIIKQKQNILVGQLEELKKQFREVSQKLLQKCHQELSREQKIKNMEAQVLKYQKQVKDFDNQLQLRGKQIKTLRQMLNSQEQNKKVEKKPEIENDDKQKEVKSNKNQNSSLRFLKKHKRDQPFSSDLYDKNQLIKGFQHPASIKKNINNINEESKQSFDNILNSYPLVNFKKSIYSESPQSERRLYMHSDMVFRKGSQTLKKSSLEQEVQKQDSGFIAI